MDGKDPSSLDKSKEINRTYLMSTPTTKPSELSSSHRLVLQRRKTSNKDTGISDHPGSENRENQIDNHGKRLTLQKRNKPGSTDRTAHATTVSHEKRAWMSSKVLSEPNSRIHPGPTLLRSASVREKGFKSIPRDPIKQTSGNPNERAKDGTSGQCTTFSTPTGKTKFENISLKKEVFESFALKSGLKPLTGNVEKQVQARSEHTRPAPSGVSKPLQHSSQDQKSTPCFTPGRNTTQTAQLSTASGGSNLKTRPPVNETLVCPETDPQTAFISGEELKMENSAVTVAVRVRPFSTR